MVHKSEAVNTKILKNIIKDHPDVLSQQNANPLSEEDIIELIHDTNVSDRTILKILQTLTKKWGRRNVVTPNVRDNLVRRKKILEPFFTKLVLDKDTDLHFKDKDGNIISRHITYCHEKPGLIAFKRLIEGAVEEEKPNIVSMDDWKRLLKMVFIWLIGGKDTQKNKEMGPKRCLVLAAVQDVPESHWNIKVLMELAKINESNFKHRQNLKLTNIVF